MTLSCIARWLSKWYTILASSCHHSKFEILRNNATLSVYSAHFSFIAIESHLSASLTLMSISSQFAWIPSNLVQLNDSFRSTFPQIDWFYWGKRVQSLMTFGIFKLLLNNRNWFHYSTWWSSLSFHCYLFQVSTIKLKTLFRGRLFLCTVFPAFFFVISWNVCNSLKSRELDWRFLKFLVAQNSI